MMGAGHASYALSLGLPEVGFPMLTGSWEVPPYGPPVDSGLYQGDCGTPVIFAGHERGRLCGFLRSCL